VTYEWTEQTRSPATTSGKQSVAELIGDVANDFARLVRQQLDLAKAELKEQAAAAGRAGAMFGVAAVAGLLALVLVSFAIVFALSEVMPAGWAALIVAVVWAVIGAVTYSVGRQRLRAVSPVPPKTSQTLKEDMQWLRNPTE
jgi:uncharacterized membrane protein YqjE